MKNTRIPLTVVIPAYNEETRLPPTLDALLTWRQSSSFDVRIIVVDDGSQDRTPEIVKDYAARSPNITLIRESHVGYMNAIISGLTKAETDLRVTIEADLPVHPRTLDEIASRISQYDIIIGSRLSYKSDVEGKSGIRRLISSLYSILFKILFRCNFSDPQIGFKLYRNNALSHILPRLRLSDDGLKSSEFMIKAYGFGYSILEIPVKYKHDPDSRLVPKGKTLIKILESSSALLSLWIQTYAETREGLFRLNPVRGGYLLFLLWPILKPHGAVARREN
jgi:glycosyltransferase involved in cell wall biosynthesis